MPNCGAATTVSNFHENIIERLFFIGYLGLDGFLGSREENSRSGIFFQEPCPCAHNFQDQ